jgi:hypothetical protein
MSAKLECNPKVTHIATGSNCMVNDTAALVFLSLEYATWEAPENSCQVVEMGAKEFVGLVGIYLYNHGTPGGIGHRGEILAKNNL